MNFLDTRLPDRFWAKCIPEPNSGCWLWLASVDGSGYGHLKGEGGRKAPTVKAHRVAYEALVGPIPRGLHIDHLCRVRTCCNPAHLEPVTNRVNVLRGVSFAATNVNKAVCPSGHAYDDVNTRWYQGRRYCRECLRLRCDTDEHRTASRERQRRKREKEQAA